MIRSARSMLGLPLIAAMAFFMQGLDATILNTALPDLAKSLHKSPLSIQSAIISYTLTVAMLIPISGWLADRFGIRRIFILSVSLFSLGSLLCALSYSLPFLVFSRVIQGVGGAMMMPVARLALLRTYPRNELLSILNFVTVPGLLGPIMGPLLGGFLVSYASWHWIFIMNIPIGILGIIYAQKYMTNAVMPKKSFDMVGFLLFGFSLVMISVSLEFLSESNDTHLHLLYYGIMAAGFLMLLLYILHAKNHTHPLIELSLFKIRTFSVGIVGNIATRLGTGSVPFLMPLMLQIGFGYSPAVAGCIMAPFAFGGIMGKSFVTRILRRMGYRKALFMVTFMIGITINLFSLQTANTPFWITVLPLLVLGFLMSIQMTSMNTITLSELIDNNASSGNSVLAVSQQLAISYGVAFSAIILQFFNTVGQGNKVDHFHYTFMTMGVFTILSGMLFLLLKPEDGNHLINRSVVKKSL